MIGCKVIALQTLRISHHLKYYLSARENTRVTIVKSISSEMAELWGLTFLQAFSLQGSIVPHLKDLTNIYLDFEAQVPGVAIKGIFSRSKYPQITS